MSFPKASGYQVVLHLTLACLATLVFILVSENRELRSPRSSAPSASRRSISVSCVGSLGGMAGGGGCPASVNDPS